MFNLIGKIFYKPEELISHTLIIRRLCGASVKHTVISGISEGRLKHNYSSDIQSPFGAGAMTAFALRVFMIVTQYKDTTPISEAYKVI